MSAVTGCSRDLHMILKTGNHRSHLKVITAVYFEPQDKGGLCIRAGTSRPGLHQVMNLWICGHLTLHHKCHKPSMQKTGQMQICYFKLAHNFCRGAVPQQGICQVSYCVASCRGCNGLMRV